VREGAISVATIGVFCELPGILEPQHPPRARNQSFV
jgi:hypothetical protein